MRPAQERLEAGDAAVLGCARSAGRPGAARRATSAWRSSFSSVEPVLDPLAHRRSNTATASPPASLAWYIAMSASRSMASAPMAGSDPRCNGHPDARGQRDLDVADADALSQAEPGPLGQLAGVVGLAHSTGHDHELVAADPGHEVAGAAVGPQPVADRVQQLVAHPVAEAVVQDPEPVEVEEHQGDRLVVPAGQQLLDVVLHVRSVGQPGQQVVGGLVGQARLGPGVLAQRPEHPPRGGGGAGDDHRRQDHPVDDRVVGTAQGDHGRHAEGHRDENEPAAHRLGLERSNRSRHVADRRVQEARHERDVGDAEGHVDEPWVDVGDVGVDEHVDGLAGQREQQRRRTTGAARADGRCPS